MSERGEPYFINNYMALREENLSFINNYMAKVIYVWERRTLVY